MTITPPPPAKSKGKGEPPAPTETRGNLSKPEPASVVALNFRVPSEFKRDFKVAAAVHGVTQSDLLQKAFAEWKQRHG